MPPSLPRPIRTTNPDWQHNWEKLSKEMRQQLNLWCKEIESLIQFEIIDYQLVGSRAYGNNSPCSDYDIVFVPKEDKYHRVRPRAAMLRAAEISKVNGVGFFIGVGPCAKHLLCYSFKDEKFYGKKPGERIDRKTLYRTNLGVFK